CADEADPADLTIGSVEFEATPEFVADAAERSTGEPYRVEVDLSFQIGAGGDASGPPFMTGEFDGDSSSTETDMGAMFGEIDDLAPPGEGVFDEFTKADLTMETITEGSTLYLRAPLYSALREMMPGGLPAQFDALADLGDEWGRVDLEALGSEFGWADVASSAGGQVADPSDYLDLVADTDDVRDLGAGDVRGDEVHGVAADVTYADVLESQGVDREDFADLMTSAMPEGGPGAQELADVVDAVLDTPMPIELWVDGAGYVRKLEFTMNMGAMFEGVDGGDDAAAMIGAASFGTAMEFFDYGDETIDIDVPAAARDAADVTDAYRQMLGMGSENA
ncbi:MAG: hypothetical protein ACRDZN_14595, partial [Acidimicrobiales bacterium]